MSEKSAQDETHQVWCDVGGTFTDCFVVFPDGTRGYTKVLSSGLVKGTVTKWLNADCFTDITRCGDPNGFWQGAIVTWLDDAGKACHSQRCIAFESESGRFRLEAARESFASFTERTRYELHCGLEAPVIAARLLMGRTPTTPLPPLQVRLGTTRGTNALLTRTGERCALVTTRGFEDLLRIGYQERPDLFALRVHKREPLHDRVLGVHERLAADGTVLEPLDIASARIALEEIYADGIRSIAVCLLHSYCNPIHETQIAQLAQEIGFTCICISSEISAKIKAVLRGETALVDAYLTPVVQSYLGRVASQFGLDAQGRMRIMSSGGGLLSTESYRGKDSVLSGPAGGAVAVEAYSKSLGIPRCIGLDMGGTSTDVCRIDGSLQIETETVKAGVRMMVPTLAIHTVAAGGGSVCWFDGVQLRVGPQSAGANPGPACYGRGGPLSITDLNLLSGRVDAESFPFQLDIHAAETQLQQVLHQVNSSLGNGARHLSAMELVQGFRRIANEHMAAAVRSISIAQGADPREHALIGFGGAAGQHICEIADLLEITQVIDPPEAGLLSALGMGLASVKRSYTRPIYVPMDRLHASEIFVLMDDVDRQARLAFESEGIAMPGTRCSYQLEMRYQGTEGRVAIEFDESILKLDNRELQNACYDRFCRRHLELFGYVRKGKPLEVVALYCEYIADSENPLPDVRDAVCDQIGTVEKKGSLSRESLLPGQALIGPILIHSKGSTTYVDYDWKATVLPDLTLRIERATPQSATPITVSRDESTKQDVAPVVTQGVDPVLREVLAQRIAAIAEQMGIVLEQTAISVNVKDRRDFSCAVFAANGDLIANAPHVPVHLGAMSQTIRCLIARFPTMMPGDCYITNDPYQGGSHLPDITVVTPVFVRDPESGSDDAANPTERTVDFFVACRAHHAEIGGVSPGSMAPTSTRLGEEGVVIPPMHLVEQGIDRSDAIESLLRNALYPSRSVPENMADLAAQQAANQRGVQAMTELSRQYGLRVVQQYLEHIQSASEAKTRAWIEKLGDAPKCFADRMDDGTAIHVCVQPVIDELNRRALKIDFSGTGPESAGNLNANPAIVSAAVIYVIRCAMMDTLPLNSGVLRCVEIHVPRGILNPLPVGDQVDWPAVAGGNVETSQRVVDCLLGALGLASASQGTMNNFLFGDSGFGYYETIGGGTGATPDGPGADAVHSHMTNTRLTDVEVLEKKYPVRLIRFEIRKGSGGTGRHAGGCGLVRQILALRKLEVSLVTSRRNTRPFGLAGGESGAAGGNWHVLSDGSARALGSSAQLSIEAGESILIETPGGGGFGTVGT